MKMKSRIFGLPKQSSLIDGWWDVTYEKRNGELWTVTRATKALALRAARDAIRADSLGHL